MVLSEAKKLIKEGKKEGGFSFKSIQFAPKNTLIKFLSEEGIKQLLQKTENQYMQDNNREMHKIDEALYFVMKKTKVELTDNGLNSFQEILILTFSFFQILD
jgi:preprotein translocase subunit SecA